MLILGFDRRARSLIALSILFFLAFGTAYYYGLHLTLLQKSGILAASGVFCLIASLFVRYRFRGDEVIVCRGDRLMFLRRAVVLAGLVLILALVNWSIAQKEALLRDGTVAADRAGAGRPALADPGRLHAPRLRASHATFPDQATSGRETARSSSPPAPDNVATLRAAPRRRHAARGGRAVSCSTAAAAGRIRIGTDAFFFQEGHAARYQGAKFGELRVGASGESVLIGLRDAAAPSARRGAESTVIASLRRIADRRRALHRRARRAPRCRLQYAGARGEADHVAHRHGRARRRLSAARQRARRGHRQP